MTLKPQTHKNIGLCSFSDDQILAECHKVGANPPCSLFFNHSWTTFLFQKGNVEISQKGFLRRLAWISGSVPVDSRWIGLYQWSVQRSSQNRPRPDCPTLAPACPCTSPNKVPSSGAPAAGSAASEFPPRWNAATAGPRCPNPQRRNSKRNPSQTGHARRDELRTDRKSVV